jgi:DNA-binding transcriptional LysR family regulator
MQFITPHNVPMSQNLDLDLIRTFVTVADSGSMTVAANLLHMTQGAVSQQIKRLEDGLGCLLSYARRAGWNCRARASSFLSRRDRCCD